MLSAVAMEIAFAICSGERPKSLPVAAAVDMASCMAWLKPFVITGTTALNRHWIS
jgi:hypothetical protein